MQLPPLPAATVIGARLGHPAYVARLNENLAPPQSEAGRLLGTGVRVRFTRQELANKLRVRPVPVPVRRELMRRMHMSREATVIDAECERLMALRVLEPVPRSQRWTGVYLPTYAIPKPGQQDKWRLITDPTWLFGKTEDPQPFHHETMVSVTATIQRDDWMASIDLTKAFYHIPVAEDHRSFLRFVTPAGRHLQYVGMPMGLRESPRNLAVALRPVLHWLRGRGVKVTAYVDDLLVVGSSEAQCAQAVKETLAALEFFGWTVNQAKCQLKPVQRIRHLGLVLDSPSLTARLPGDKRRSIEREAKMTARAGSSTLRDLQRLMGRIDFATVAVEGLRGQTHALRRLLAGHSGQRPATLVRPTDDARTELRALPEWMRRWNTRPFTAQLTSRRPERTLHVDTSPWAVGAHLDEGRHPHSERLEPHEQVLQHNLRELLGAERMLRTFMQKGLLVSGNPGESLAQWPLIAVCIDNVTATFYLNRETGRSRKCSAIGKRIAEWARAHRVHVSATWIPGAKMELADALSRGIWDHDEWTLRRDAQQAIWAEHGQPDIDVFATRANRVCERTIRNALTSQKWSTLAEHAWINPPMRVMQAAVNRVVDDSALRATMLTPWARHAWWPTLMQRATLVGRVPRSMMVLPEPTVAIERREDWDIAVWSIRPTSSPAGVPRRS